MPNRQNLRSDLRAHSLWPNNKVFFPSPLPAGRKITAGFTYVQRISKAASYDVWFPDPLKQALERRVAAGQPIGAPQFPAQWAAVRQFELLQESGNHKIYDLDPSKLERSMLDLSRSMRAGGYRVTVATLGSYAESSSGDDLEILDHRLQERIAQMIHMLYLDDPSEQASQENAARLADSSWDYRTALPHVGMVLGARDLFHPRQNEEEGKAAFAARKHRQARRFFDILNQLPHQHIVHDTAIGLQLPELNGENQWNYIAASDETLGSFNRVLGDLFDKFDHISLSQLQEREGASAEIKSSTFHMRGYGDHLQQGFGSFYRQASLVLN